MLFDGDCRFCRLWIQRWKQSTGDGVDYVPLQDASVAENFPELARAELEEAVHFIAADGLVYRSAEAVFRSLTLNPKKQWPLRLYEAFPTFARLANSSYGFIASHRQMFSRATRILWGEHVERSADSLTRWLFLRGLGVIYLIAFISLWTQLTGLIGQRGILPAANLVSQVHGAVEANNIGLDRFRLLPTLCWFSASDTSLHSQCALGVAFAVALIAGLAPRICLFGLWLLYLSLSTVGQDFLSFQWDILLLETGLLAIFLSPAGLFPHRAREKPPSRTSIWMLRFLLFKLMFLSGVVKLASGDPLWRNLTALSRHYETQPLPNPIAWYFHQMPMWFHKTSCALMFTIELIAPFILFAPRRLRMIGGAAIALLQVFIILTGNFTFFNWLTLLLCVLTLDDFTWRAFLPRKISEWFKQTNDSTATRRNLPAALMAIVLVSVSIAQIFSASDTSPFWTPPIIAVYRWIAPLRSINSYGLFAVMTPDRPEIILEGSNDGREWKEYSFPHKPGALNRRPTFVAPHQPRLDWQMWFAALSDARNNPWFIKFCARLLEGSPEVIGLLETNPFPNAPPRFIRARLYDYQFTTRAERRQTGAWWKREFKREYLPPISLGDLIRQPP
jgi:predicted DCC family thiol-disulfide oxidoreductase YuxK